MVAVAQLATSDIWQATDNPWLLNYAFNYMTASDVKHNKRSQNSSTRAYALHVSASAHQMLLVSGDCYYSNTIIIMKSYTDADAKVSYFQLTGWSHKQAQQLKKILQLRYVRTCQEICPLSYKIPASLARAFHRNCTRLILTLAQTAKSCKILKITIANFLLHEQVLIFQAVTYSCCRRLAYSYCMLHGIMLCTFVYLKIMLA